MPFSPRMSLPSLLGGFALLGFVLRIAAARGDYWLDEAWSAVFARAAATVGDVLFAINHDNNHHLNTLWLMAVGWGSPPMLGRALSILCGTVSVVVAGLIGARRGLVSAAGAAALFALSPIMVTYGSEARGYAPMLLALLISFLIVDREIDGDRVPHGAEWLGLAALIGTLAHVSMLFGVAALSGWMVIVESRRQPRLAALRTTLRFMARALAGVAVILLMILAGAVASPEGMRIGSLTGFSWPSFIDALAYMIAYTIGWPWLAGPWILILLLLPQILRRDPALVTRIPFYLIAILGLPLLVALVHPDNSAYPRYYLLSSVGLLLLIAELLPVRPQLAAFLLGLTILGSVSDDVVIIKNMRADPGKAIEAMEESSPGRGAVLIDNPRDAAVIEAAAARRGYPLTVDRSCVEDTDYFYVQQIGANAFPLAALRCGHAFQPIAGGEVRGLSGMDWQLYGKVR